MTLIEAAERYAERGLHVIPVHRLIDGKCTCGRAVCQGQGKHPAIDSWQTAASTDTTILRDWFAGREDRNVGIVCGPSGVVVVDIDPRNGGNETLADLITELGALPVTVTADSGGGGAHYVFRAPAGELESKLGPGVDLLRGPRQFLVEPSVHPSGGRYRWRDGLSPEAVQVAGLPEAWVERVRRKAPTRATSYLPPLVATDIRVERAGKYLAKMPPAVQGSGGSIALFNAVSVAMIGFDLDADTVRSLIADYNQRCDPPWSEREIEHKLRSVAQRTNRVRGYLLDSNRAPVSTTRQALRAAMPVVQPSPDVDWSEHLSVKKNGKYEKFYRNTEIFVRLSPEYRGRWAFNEMTAEPWFDGEPLRETTLHAIRARIEERLSYTPPIADVKAAALVAASACTFHPVRQYLDSVDWDGRARLADAAREHLGADGELYAEMIRRWMIGAVARAMRPGCKLDTALMLQGNQGLGKSTFFATLAGQWHSDSTIDIGNKDAYQQIHAAWIYEFSELENVVSGRAESRLKAFMTSTHDLFRAPYAATATSRARSVALCGSTNRQEILTDDTGSRRFWIVPVARPIDREQLAHARDQLWAEARAAYESGEPWWFERDLEEQRELSAEDYETDDVWTEHVAAYLAHETRTETTVARVLEDALKIEPARQDKWAQIRVGKILKRANWQKQRIGPRGARVWTYFRRLAQTEWST